MMTEQTYVSGRGNTTHLEQMVEKSTSTAQNAAKTPQLPDRWQTSNPQVLKAQSDLLDLVDSYAEYTNPIIAINEILERWLTANPDQLRDEYYQTHLVTVLRLITFLTELRDAHQKLIDKYEVYKGEVQHD